MVMNKLKMRSKLILFAIVPLIVTMTVAMAITISLQLKMVDHDVNLFRERLIAERKNEIKDAVIISQHSAEYLLKHSPSQTDTIEQLRDLLGSLRFSKNNTGYFFVYNNNGDNLVHPPKPSVQGKNFIGLTDPNGVRLIAELAKAAQQGGGFVSYIYPKPGISEPQPKISYAAPIKGSNWFIGTGVYIDDIEAAVAAYQVEAINQLQSTFQLVFFSSVVLGIVTILLILYFANRLTRPIRSMVNTLDDIADGEGDLTRRLQVYGSDEIAQLGVAFNRFADKLQSTIRDVSQATEQVSGAATQIYSQTAQVSEQLGTHNNETDQVASAISQMSSTASEVAQKASEVSAATNEASSDSQEAQQQIDNSVSSIHALVTEVEQASSHIHSLHLQSQKIDKVLGVIGEIAEQTNLLALNAAIEAARAGEQGRGFAVVADEVRELASRTQTSTHEIKEMLDELHHLVSQAVAAMNNSQNTCTQAIEASGSITASLASVTTAVETINSMTDHIATAAAEQNTVTDEISHNIVTIQDIVANLLQSSGESETVARQLNHAGGDLNQLVRQFKV